MKEATPLWQSDLGLPADSYVYRVVECQDKSKLAGISSDDSLRIVSLERPLVDRVFTHTHQGVTSLERISDEANLLLTAGRDGSSRVWDLRTGSKVADVTDGSLQESLEANFESPILADCSSSDSCAAALAG